MKISLGFVFIVSCYFLCALSLAEDAGRRDSATVIPAGKFSTPAQPKPTTVPPKPKPTTVPPKPTTVPPKPKPTTIPPKPTTVPPKPKPTTVPPKPTTVPPKPKPTTVPPKPTTTTTTAPMTTTPSPTPGVFPGTYNLTTGKEKQVCVKAKLGLSIQLRTEKANGTFIVNPNKTTAVGQCKDTTANLTLSFAQGFITFLFNKNVTAKTVSVESLSFELNYPLAKAAMPYKGNNNSRLFVARVGHSYSCKEQSIIMGNGLYLDIIKENIQAFNFSKSNEFGSPDLCAADQPNYNVAIAVGVTLLVLIIIVVVAYLVGRRRRSDGYQSL